MAVSQSISLTEGTQSISNNTSQVTFTWTSTQSGESYNSKTRTAYYYVSINGGEETEYEVSYTLPKSSTKIIVEEAITVPHNPDGTGTISVRTWMDTRISAGVVQKTKSLTLTTIPRQSSLSLSATSVNIGSTITANITRASARFKHDVEFYINDTYRSKTYTDVSTSQAFTIPDSWHEAMPDQTKRTAYCRITTYYENLLGKKIIIGEEVKAPFTVRVTASPSAGTLSITPVPITTLDGDSRQILVKGKNKVNVSISNVSAGKGSTISSYKFEALSGNTLLDTSELNSTSTTLGTFNKSGTLTFRVTITNSRKQQVVKTSTYTCYDYKSPSFTSFDAFRANDNEDADVNGMNLRCNYGTDFSDVNSTNKVTVTAHYSTKTNSYTSDKTFIELGENNNTYNVYLTLTDNYGGKATSPTITVFGQSRILNITSDGTGIAIGKMADSSNSFECRWPAAFNDSVECDTLKVTNDVECKTLKVNTTPILDLIYPVGSIYLSVNSTNPSNLFGGTWTQIKDKFLLSAGDTYTANTTGGNASVTLETKNLPSHTHTATSTYTGGSLLIRGAATDGHNIVSTSLGGNNITSSEYSGDAWGNSITTNSTDKKPEQINIGGTVSTTIGNTGSGSAINILPPYLTVYMWKRTK